VVTISVGAADASARPPQITSSFRTRAVAWAPITAPALLALALGIWGLDRGSMYGGEEASYWAAKLPVHDLFRMLGNIDAVHGLYYLLMHFVLWFGGGEVLLRIPSVLATAGAVALTAATGRRLGASTLVMVVAGLLLAVTPMVNQYAQSGRSYAIDLFAVAATGYVLLWALDAPTWRRWLPYGALVTFSGYMHEMTTLMILAHGVTLLVSRQRRSTLGRWALTCVAALAALAPLILISAAQVGQLAYVRAASLHSVYLLARCLFGPSPIAVAVIAGLVLIGVLGTHRSDGVVTLQQLAVPLLLVPPTALLSESAIAHPLYAGPRYLMFCLSAAALLAATGIDRVVRRWRPSAKWAAGVLVVALVLGLNWPTQLLLRTPAGHLQDMAGAARFLGTHAVPGDGVLYVPAGMGLAPLGYPDDYRDVTAIARAESPEEAANLYGSPLPMAQVRLNMRARSRIWVVGRTSSRRVGYRGDVEMAVLHHRFQLAQRAYFPGVNVALWTRRRP